ncbi:poly(U)-specific endoribonuclease homolog isoform X1 [Nasonia vitripennis]|uniref:EndoU domain-containing protein n=1 Tax=Nasonia vitripennis TaxID=7425 RepID=A0A7M7QI36_NASVI|nr:poly(U)-specific endoribonuclease homolog isoform X1 [Nasonia vitripennis]
MARVSGGVEVPWEKPRVIAVMRGRLRLGFGERYDFVDDFGDIDARKSSRRGGSSGSSGWGLSKSRSTPRSKPQQQQQSHGSSGGSNPGTIGWNVPGSKPVGSGTAAGSSTYPKASAPSEHVSKTSATNVQSGYPGSSTGGHGNPPPYSPSGGYSHGAPPAYNPSSSGGYHGGPPSYSGGYHGGAPPAYSSGGYNGGANHGFNPSYGSYGSGHGFNSQPGQGYNPSYGHSSYGSQPQTVIVQGQNSRPGIGQLAKEAFVFAGVSAGVNAAVNRILPGGIYGHSPSYGASSSGVVPPVSHTQITYNNYYNNGTGEAQPGAPAGAAAVAAPVPPAGPAAAAPAPAAPDTPPAPGPAAATPAAEPPANGQQQQQQNAASPTGFITSDAELQKLTEDLFTKDTNNAFKHITVKVQGQKMDDSVTDDAAENLLEVKPDAWEIPTVKAVVALLDNYELDVKTKETVTSEERKEESDLLDAFIATDVMKTTMKFLAEKGYVPNDEYEFKDSLKRIWFSQFKRIDGDPSSSGFETVFLAEKFDNEIIGLHDWIYFAKQEEAKKIDYLGYIKKLDLGTNGAIVKGRSKLNDVVQPITTIFVGTSPELEMALYTLCFYTRPNTVCPIKTGGADFLIVANAVNYFGKDILISAFPDI